MKVNGKDDIPDIMENKIHVPNHQPVLDSERHVKLWSSDQKLIPKNLCFHEDSTNSPQGDAFKESMVFRLVQIRPYLLAIPSGSQWKI